MRRLTTDEQRERFYAAKDRGGLCAACGRPLGADEPVYIERVVVDRKLLAAPGARWSHRSAYRDAPLGEECASPEFLARTQGQTPEPCEHCGRPVYYDVARARRLRTLCSMRCTDRVSSAGRAARRRGS